MQCDYMYNIVTCDLPMTFASYQLSKLVHLGGAGLPDHGGMQKARGSSALQCVLFRIVYRSSYSLLTVKNGERFCGDKYRANRQVFFNECTALLPEVHSLNTYCFLHMWLRLSWDFLMSIYITYLHVKEISPP